MYIHPKIIKQREKLTEVLQNLRVARYQVFISKAEDSAYAIAEKDGHIVGICRATYGTGLHLSYKYKPGRTHGSGVGYGDMDWGYNCQQKMTSRNVSTTVRAMSVCISCSATGMCRNICVITICICRCLRQKRHLIKK